jgi:pyruvate/2-oxoglutarate dehydrogenase complex dihydrolipoamide dehydrogenase (E3) component
VYTTPVLATVGHTRASARAAGIEPLVARAAYAEILEDPLWGLAAELSG